MNRYSPFPGAESRRGLPRGVSMDPGTPHGRPEWPTEQFLPLHGLRGFLSKTLLETRMHS